MPTLLGDNAPDGKPADRASEGAVKVAGLGAEAPETTGLESWPMEATLLETLAGAKSWNIRAMQSEWYLVWYKVRAEKPQVQALGIRVAEVDAKALRHKLYSKVEEEKALLKDLGLILVVNPPSPPVGTPGRKKIVLSKDCKQEHDQKTPESKVVGKAKVLAMEMVEADPVTTKKAGVAGPIDLEEIGQVLTAKRKTPTCEECVAYVHNLLGAEVVEEGSKPTKDGFSVVGSGFLIADDKLIGLRVVGIGAVDSSGSRGQFAKVTRVTNARVEVEFEDGKEGQYFTKSKAEPVDVHGFSLVTGKEVFLQAKLDKAVRHRQASGVRNKLNKGRRTERKKAPGSQAVSPAVEKEKPAIEKEKPAKSVRKYFSKASGVQAESEPPSKKRKAKDKEEGLGLKLLSMEELWAQAVKAGVRSIAHGLVHLTRTGVIPVEAFKNFRDKLNEE